MRKEKENEKKIRAKESETKTTPLERAIETAVAQQSSLEAGRIQEDVHPTLQEESFSTLATYGGPTLNPKPKTEKEYCSALFQSKSKAMGLVWTKGEY